MPKRLICPAPGEIRWQEIEERALSSDEIKICPNYGVEKHGTMAAFVKGYANERGGWDGENRVHSPEGVLWQYPIPLGNMQFGTIEDGEAVAWWGPFEDVAIVKRSSLIKIGKLDWKDVAMQDPGEFALGALRDGSVRIGDTVAVFGLGAIGLATVQLAKVAGASEIFAIDPIPARRKLAEKFGARGLDPVDGDVGMRIRTHSKMKGVDVSIDYSGSARALQSAFRATAYGGVIAYGAFPAPFPTGLDFGGEAHMNRHRLIFTRACSDPNPDHPRWNESRIRISTYDLIAEGKLSGQDIVDPPIPFSDLLQSYREIETAPERRLKLSVAY